MQPIFITCGDPGGIGPEVALKAMESFSEHPPFIFIGPKAIILDPFLNRISPPLKPYTNNALSRNTCYFFESSNHNTIIRKAHHDENGHIAYQAIKTATELMKKYNHHHLVTAPISKEGLISAGYPFSGHTPLLAHLYKTSSVSMAFYAKPLKVILASVHIPIHEIESELTRTRLSTTIQHAMLFAEQLNLKSPKIAICGLNPHAGENGLIGQFEINTLAPVLANYPTILGPYSPDTIFRDAINDTYDIVIALYHDQGLIPIKLLAFDSAVNVTIGLPICRTSPDHGTAYDIAYTNQANPSSMIHAIQYCMKIA